MEIRQIRIRSYLAQLGIVTVIYFVVAKLSLALTGHPSPVWPPAGFALALILLFGSRLWPGIAMGTIFEVVLEGLPLQIAFATAAGSAGGALAGAYLLKRMGFHNSMERLRDVLGLVILGCVVSTTISATFGAFSFSLSGIIPWAASGSFWMTWWLEDVLGVIVVTPLVLVWSIRPHFDRKPAKVIEALVLLISLVLVSDLVFSEPAGIISSPYIMFPFLIWAALRFGQKGATIAIMIVSGIAIWHTAHSFGPFVKETPAESLLFLQVFTGVVAFTILILASVITESKQGEKALKKSETSLKMAQELGKIGNWEFDLKTQKIYWSDEVYVLYERDKKLGPPSAEEEAQYYLPEVTKKLHELASLAMETGNEYRYDLTARLPGGRIALFNTSINPVKDEKGNVIQLLGTVQDITERKQEEETHLENLRLETADKAKSEFLANMSHELRTPLNASIGFSELLKMGLVGKLNEKQEEYVDHIIASNQFLLILINDILDLSKIEAGKIELVPEKMSVPVIISETLSLIKEKAMMHNVLLETEFDPELEFIEADKQRVKQVLFNLLSNGVKFSKKEGGVLTITVKKEGDMAKVSVSDTGIGFKEENIGKLFQKFEQLESGISQKYGGTGLGLAITKHLVELHGGRIWAESRYGEGSTFIFLLPIEMNKKGII